MRTEEEIINFLIEFSKVDENIRATLLTSSRANQNAVTDFLSDYDIELYVRKIEVVKKNDDWLNPFGKIISRWPFQPKSTFNDNWITRLILFADGVRIDFQITDKINEKLDNIDYGHRILIDKDNILADLPKPSYAKYNIKKPSREEFESLVNEFWWNAYYVPKYLWRDELPYAKSMMGQVIHDEFLKKAIDWHIGINTNWGISSGANGRHFKKLLEKDIWDKYISTFAGANMDDNWNSFFSAVDLFSTLTKRIGIQLGYNYPEITEMEMKMFYNKIKNAKKNEERGGGQKTCPAKNSA